MDNRAIIQRSLDYIDMVLGYDSVVHLTEEERRAIPYVILANQFVCVAWFGAQEMYAELFETNRQMTTWLLEQLHHSISP